MQRAFFSHAGLGCRGLVQRCDCTARGFLDTRCCYAAALIGARELTVGRRGERYRASGANQEVRAGPKHGFGGIAHGCRYGAPIASPMPPLSCSQAPKRQECSGL